ncbi:MAG: hypothetical protein H6700_10355 [Myxococcales bacterium]|nr:hypothetical protein [Myxococcales bacterium]
MSSNSIYDAHVVLVAHGGAPGALVGAELHASVLRSRFERVSVLAYRGASTGVESAPPQPSSTRVVVVPFAMADGWFVSQVAPGVVASALGDTAARAVWTQPVGVWPGLVPIVIGRVDAALFGGSVIVVGHGTERDPRSGDAARALAAALVRAGTSAEARFLDQEPRLAPPESRDHRAWIVVPMFAGWGPHVTVDVPSALGCIDGQGTAGQRVPTPHVLEPIGCWPELTAEIEAQVVKALVA